MPDLRQRAVGRTAAVAAAALSATLLAPVSAHAVTGTAESDNTRGFTARLDIGQGQRACSAALVDPEWLLTAVSCFAEDPGAELSVPAGVPELRTTATIGRTDLTTTAGQVRQVVELVPRTDRDVVLARLSDPVLNVPPVPLSAVAPSAGEDLTATGYGRTTDEWAPLKLHSGTFTAAAGPDGVDLPVTGQDGAAVCAGDTGGPLLRTTSAGTELVGINSRSFQGGCFGVDETQTSTDAVSARVDDLASWVASKVGRTPFADFNGDGVEDLAVGDPRATVGGDADAGLVRVVYGGDRGTDEISQDVSFVPGGAEPGDRFGEALAVADHNQDGYTDLIVGIPYEDLAGQADTGMVSVIHGSRDGLGKGPASLNLEQGQGSGGIGGTASEAGDLMGFSLAAGRTASGASYLVIGVPGEDIGSAVDCGAAFYVQGDRSVAVNQDKDELAGTAESGDRFGHSVAADSRYVAIGVPGEAIGTLAESGGVHVMNHAFNAAGAVTQAHSLHQDTDGVSGVAEAGDEFGSSVALTEYRPEGESTATRSVLAVGSPGEALTVGTAGRDDAGRVVTFQLTHAGGWSELQDIQQEKADVTGVAEKGDRFGEKVAVANTDPRAAGSVTSMLLAVGIPGETVDGATGSGAVQKFSLLGLPGDHDRWIEPGLVGLPGTPGAGERLGTALTATGTRIYLGMPNGPSTYGAVHTIPWTNVTDGPVQDAVTHQPGQGGLPAAGKAFGTTVQ
ncbi:trypsin-like serine protease [Streptomyces sp. NPDC057433]|uniref:trypsin-like serine protease n=1 Tax=Streptomyces sp. NPDC057433 TaxID=3346132 RepID=UPI0036A3C72C